MTREEQENIELAALIAELRAAPAVSREELLAMVGGYTPNETTCTQEKEC